MSIQAIVTQALQDGYLTPAMEAEVGRICESAAELSNEEYNSLDRLMGALLNGEVVAMPHKQFINVMEEMVVTEVVAQVSKYRNSPDEHLDISDIAAYALNRLPPLYATSEEGATYQRQRGQEELSFLIRQQVTEGVNRYLDRPQLENRKPLDKPAKQDLLSQVSAMLETFAPD
ncbi:MAG: late competence development ComFB family protein [Synechocystis sp.]|nr:late competence development ComFB family protein [Synechocystis sp.]